MKNDPPHEADRVEVWRIRLMRTAGGFLNWCDEVGIKHDRQWKFPDPPDPAKIRLSLPDEGSRKALAEMDDDVVVKWMYGHFYSFLGVGPDGRPLGAEQ